MNLRASLILSTFTLINSITLHAGEISTSTVSGTGSLSQELSVYHDGFSASYTFYRTEVGATLGSSSEAYNDSHAVTLGLSHGGENARGVSGSFSTTPAESIRALGLSGYLSHQFKLSSLKKDGDEDEDNSEGFEQVLEFKGTLGFTHYKQSFTPLVPARKGSKKLKSLTADQSINQFLIGVKGNLELFQWFSLNIAFNRYLYSKGIANFLATLDDPRAVRSGAAMFGSTLTGFSSQDIDVGFDFNLPLSVTLSPSSTLSTNAATKTVTHSYSIDISRVWSSKWTTGIIGEQSISGSDKENLYTLNLSYNY
jgi:hypothetical protein